MASTALLIMDVQQGIVARFAGDDGYLDRLATAITAARAAGVMVGYVTIAFRPGYPEVSDRNKSFAAIAGSGRFTDGDPGTQIPAAVAPAPGEAVVIKRRVSAFAGSDLDVLLRPAAPTTWCWPASPPAGWCCPPSARPPTWTTG